MTVGGRPGALTALEYKLLCYLVRRPFQALDRATLLEEVWGYTIGDGSTIMVHVRRLREKIETGPAAPLLIRTVWGLGYAFHPTFDNLRPCSDRGPDTNLNDPLQHQYAHVQF